MTTKVTKTRKKVSSSNKKDSTKTKAKSVKNKLKSSSAKKKRVVSKKTKKTPISTKSTSKTKSKVKTTSKRNSTSKSVSRTNKKVVARVTVKSITSNAKKRSTKKTVSKTKNRKVSKNKDLIIANGPTSFWVTDGQVLDSLITLKIAFGKMTKKTYDYHIKGESNDFVEWVSLVLKDRACARDLEKSRTPKSAADVITEHLKSYKF